MIHGKGAQLNPTNPFLTNSLTTEHDEGIDEYVENDKPKIQVFYETPKTVISKNKSPDLKHEYSVNPYQGCEHGCVYCYARNSHTYWGWSAGLDFETKIVVKKTVAHNLANEFMKKNYRVKPIMLSGNTDCYQPLERKYKLTRGILEVALKYRHPISLITKNALVLRDLDLITQLAERNLIHVHFSMTSLVETVRRKLEPRTSTAKKKLHAIEILRSHHVPVAVMAAPIIPGLNDSEIPALLKATAKAGALSAGYTVVRLNGQIALVFEDWLDKMFPEKADKIKNQIRAMHGGNPNDSSWGRRMSGEGAEADMIKQLFNHSKKQYFADRKMPPLETHHFLKGGNYSLFD